MREGDITNFCAFLFDDNPIPMMVVDPDLHIVKVNQRFTDVTGYSFEEIQGQKTKILSSNFTPRQTYKDMWESINTNGKWSGKVWNKKKNGDVFPAMLFIAKFGEHGYAASFYELTLEEDFSRDIIHIANHDQLTGLSNRHSILNRLENLLGISEEYGGKFALLYVDMNRFKSVNDLLGHRAGDQLLKEVGARISSLIRGNDMAARIGGDEFVVLLEGATPLSASHVARRLLKSLSLPYTLVGKEVRSSPSIGVAVYPENGTNAEELLHNADMAMYDAKSSYHDGVGHVRFFCPEMNEDVLGKLQIEEDLRIAIKTGQLSLHYQPQIDSNTMKVTRVEALLRWNHPDKGNIPPNTFIPVAEESGLIIPIGQFVIEEAFAELSSWRKHGIKDVGMAINLSCHQLKQYDLPSVLIDAMKKYDLVGSDIEIEITESVSITNPDEASKMIKRLHELGIKVAMDDFGTGYSSLSYLRHLPIDSIKLDKSFVQHATDDSHDAAISVAAINLAHSLELKVVAEGVETISQQDFLIENSCDYLQGFLFCNPLPGADAMAFIMKTNGLASNDAML